MAEKDLNPEEKETVKSGWQMQKENWYDRIPLNKKQLDKINGVVAHADWKKGIAVVEYDRDVSDDAIRQALAWTDYKVTSIEESK